MKAKREMKNPLGLSLTYGIPNYSVGRGETGMPLNSSPDFSAGSLREFPE
jgi:hypothetical protein